MNPKRKPKKLDLLGYSFWLLSRRDYGEAELTKKFRQKVKSFGISLEEGESKITEVLKRLKELNYLDDEKFVRRFLATRVEGSPRGKYLLKFELKKKGIPEELFEKAWEEGGYSEEILAERLLEQKKRQFARFSGDKRKKKIFSLLASRGFSGDIIYNLRSY